MEELLKLNICRLDKPSQLRFLYNKISVKIRGLEALRVKSEQYGSLLIPIIMAKLSAKIRVQVARNTSQDVWEIYSLLYLIQGEIEAREISEKIKATTKQVKCPPPSRSSLPTAGTFFDATSNKEPTVPNCVYCSGKHFPASCENVTNIDAWKSILKCDRRCFTCIGKGHNSEQCEKSCRKCGSQNHHHQFAQNYTTIHRPVNCKRSQLPLHQGINLRMELQQLRPMPRVQTQNAVFYYRRAVPSPRMKKERNQLPSWYYSTMEVKGRTSLKIYVRDYSLNLFKTRS